MISGPDTFARPSRPANFCAIPYDTRENRHGLVYFRLYGSRDDPAFSFLNTRPTRANSMIICDQGQRFTGAGISAFRAYHINAAIQET
jgi:hypothetical protein